MRFLLTKISESLAELSSATLLCSDEDALRSTISDRNHRAIHRGGSDGEGSRGMALNLVPDAFWGRRGKKIPDGTSEGTVCRDSFLAVCQMAILRPVSLMNEPGRKMSFLDQASRNIAMVDPTDASQASSRLVVLHSSDSQIHFSPTSASSRGDDYYRSSRLDGAKIDTKRREANVC